MIVRNVRLTNFKPKTLTLAQFKNQLNSVSVPELLFLVTLRSHCVTQEEFQFLCQAVDDPKTIDRLFAFLFERLKIPETPHEELEQTAAPAEAELPIRTL
jgi:hypothetical protein